MIGEMQRTTGRAELIEADLTGEIFGAAVSVHRELGPGLLESTYEACMCHELGLREDSVSLPG